MRINAILSWVSAALLFLAVLLFLPSAGQCNPQINSPPALAVMTINDCTTIAYESQSIEIIPFSPAASQQIQNADQAVLPGVQYSAPIQRSTNPATFENMRCIISRQEALGLNTANNTVKLIKPETVQTEPNPEPRLRAGYHIRT